MQIFHHAQIDSTNEEAKRLILQGKGQHGDVLTADEQLAGRGRAGRSWVTPPMTALAMSILLRPTAPLPVGQLSLLGGLAVLEGIQNLTGLTPKLKWPNDVLLNDQKVAGVLAEALFIGNHLEAVIVGMGVNVNAAPPPETTLAYAATSLAHELGREVDRLKLRDAILESFFQRYPQMGTPALTQAWAAKLAYQGETVKVVGLTEDIEGVLNGVTEEGALLIRLATGDIKKILVGDVHLRGTRLASKNP